MKRRFLKTVIAVCTATMMFGMTAFAAPQKMPDGGTFDPQFYAQTYPDVAAAFGTDPNALYQHYKTYGQKEGRQPYDPAINVNQPTVVSTKQYGTGLVIWGATPAIESALNAGLKGDIITLQTRSDGTIIMTESANKSFLDIYTPTAPLKDQNGKAYAGSFYINSVAAKGANTRLLIVYDGFIGIYQYGLEGTSGALLAAETFFET